MSEKHSEGPTPRTDSALIALTPSTEWRGYDYVFADFARQLEREWVGMKDEVQICHQKIARLEAAQSATTASDEWNISYVAVDRLKREVVVAFDTLKEAEEFRRFASTFMGVVDGRAQESK